MSADLVRRQLEDQRAQIQRDLAELEDQVGAGEIDEATAAGLRATYRAEEQETVARLGSLETEPVASRSRGRMLAGTAVLVVGAGLLTWGVVQAIEPRPEGGFVTGGIAQDVVADGGVDLDDVTNEEMEAVIAENPDVPGMRIALARRYFLAEEYGHAIDHYLYLLEHGQADAEVLANVGWIVFVNGEPETAAGYLGRATASSPGYGPAWWYLANVRLYGLEDPAGAIQAVDNLLAVEGVPDDLRTAAEGLRAEAENGL